MYTKFHFKIEHLNNFSAHMGESFSDTIDKYFSIVDFALFIKNQRESFTTLFIKSINTFLYSKHNLKSGYYKISKFVLDIENGGIVSYPSIFDLYDPRRSTSMFKTDDEITKALYKSSMLSSYREFHQDLFLQLFVDMCNHYEHVNKKAVEVLNIHPTWKEGNADVYAHALKYQIETNDAPDTDNRSFRDIHDEWKDTFNCFDCGNTEHIDFYYIRTVSNGEEWECVSCGRKSIYDNEPNEDNF